MLGELVPTCSDTRLSTADPDQMYPLSLQVLGDEVLLLALSRADTRLREGLPPSLSLFLFPSFFLSLTHGTASTRTWAVLTSRTCKNTPNIDDFYTKTSTCTIFYFIFLAR